MRAISGSFMPCVVTAGVPMRTPLVTKGDRGSSGIVFLLSVMPARSSTSCAILPVSSASNVRVDEQQVVVGASRTKRKPSAASAAARACAFARFARVLAEARVGGLVERDGLGCDHVLERPSLQSGEHRLVDRGP